MSREKREIIYSIIVLITIPALMVASTLFFVSSVRQMYNRDISKKANLANSVIVEALRQDIVDKNSNNLNQALADIKGRSKELVNLAIYTEQDGSLEILAQSEDVQAEIADTTSLQIRIVFDRKQSVAKLEQLETATGITQVWTVSTPLIDSSSEKVLAVVNSSLSTADSDELIDSILKTPLIFGVACVLVVMALLFRHLRFVDYARLLARQKEINQTMSDFLSVATHELKAPTTIIKGYIANVLEDEGNPLNQSTKDQLNTALVQTDRLNNLVKDLLNVSRVEQGRVEYNLQNVVLSDVITSILNNYRLAAKEKGIEIYYQPDPGYIAYADAGRVQEIFTNLIDNAIKYSQKGVIQITHKLQDKTIVTSIRDNGIGMSAEQRKRLFQRFYRIQSEQTKNISGTGLGLWIIKQYIEAMGGEIGVDSMLGVGTEFSVSLLKIKK